MMSEGGRPAQAEGGVRRYDVFVDGKKVREFEASGAASARAEAVPIVRDIIAECGKVTSKTRLIRGWVSDQDGERIIHVGVTIDPEPVRCTGGGHEWERTGHEEDYYFTETRERCGACGRKRTHLFDKDYGAAEAFTVTTYWPADDDEEDED